jgi:hypothetical protein
MIKQEEHLTENGILKIIGLKTSLNRGLPDNLTEGFPNIVPIPRPDYVFKGIPDPFWVSGFISGDGSFNLKIGSSATTSIGVRTQLRFGITLHIRELDVIKGLAAYFNLLIPAMCSGKTLRREKLSNSGDTLKLMVPSYSQKAISGWTNYPCTVTSHMMIEKEMGNRGSKSELLSYSVKEQRADGSWCINSNFMNLRCALMGWFYPRKFYF